MTGWTERFLRTGPALPRPAAVLLGVGIAVTGGWGEASAQGVAVCDRTVQIRDAIEAASGGASCASLTLHHLREITALDLSDEGIATLRAGDFDGLARLATLDLSGNLLTSLPSGVFDELYLLKTLRLNGNQLTALPDGIFDELFLLEELTLHGNRFTSLSADLFGEFSRFSGIQANGAAPDNSGAYPRITRFLDRHDVSSPEEFIAALPTTPPPAFHPHVRIGVARRVPTSPAITQESFLGVPTGSSSSPGTPIRTLPSCFGSRSSSCGTTKRSGPPVSIDFSGAGVDHHRTRPPARLATVPSNKPLWGGVRHLLEGDRIPAIGAASESNPEAAGAS